MVGNRSELDRRDVCIFADFMNADPDGRVRLNCRGTHDDLVRHGIQLREGILLRLSDNELSADGRITWSDDERDWVAVIDWRAI